MGTLGRREVLCPPAATTTVPFLIHCLISRKEKDAVEDLEPNIKSEFGSIVVVSQEEELDVSSAEVATAAEGDNNNALSKTIRTTILLW